MINLIAAKWREFAQLAGQYKKNKQGLTSPTSDTPPSLDKMGEAGNQGKESGLNFHFVVTFGG